MKNYGAFHISVVGEGGTYLGHFNLHICRFCNLNFNQNSGPLGS